MNTLTQVFDWLLATSFRASLLVIAVLLIQAALRRHLSARMRHALWLPVLVVLLMPVLPQSRWSIEHVFHAPPQPAQSLPAVSTPMMAEPLPVVFAAPTAMPEPIDWRRVLLIIWLCGSIGILLLGSISFMLTLRSFKRTRHPASDELLATLAQIAREVRLRQIPRVLIASTISSPAVTGLLRPTLLLPAQFDREFSPAEARLVLKHELMHLKRGDLPLNALMCLLMALHWFNPLLWIAFFKIRADREAACDAQVLQDAPTDRRIEYGHALLKVETAFRPRGLSLGFVGIFQRGSALRSRIHSIAVHRDPHPAMKAMVALCMLLMTFLGITRAASNDAKAPQISIAAKFIQLTIRTDHPAEADKALAELLADVPMLSNDSKPLKALLEDAQFQILMRSLSHRKGVDLMATPTVTTRSGQQATIEVAREFGLPSETKPPLQKVGVFFRVLPTLTDKGMLDLTLNPKVVEFDGFVKDLKGQNRPVFSELKADTQAHMKPGQTAIIDLGYRVDKQEVRELSELGIVESSQIDHFMRRTLVFVTAQLIKPKTMTAAPSQTESQPAKSSAEPQKPDSNHIQNKLEKIIIPSVQFHDATVEECIAFLRVKSSAHDTTTSDPTQRGVSILLRPSSPPAKTSITLDLKDVPLGEALHYVAELAHLKMSIQPYSVVIGQTVPATREDNHPENQTRKPEVSPATGKTILPNIDFHDAKLADCLDFIHIKSRELDPAKKGVNIVLKPEVDDAIRITLSLKNVPVSEALRYCAELAGYNTISDGDVFVIAPKIAIVPVPGLLFTQVFAADPAFLTKQGLEQSTSKNLRQLLTSNGMKFPTGSSIIWNPSTKQIVLRNTQENMVWLEKWLDGTK